MKTFKYIIFSLLALTGFCAVSCTDEEEVRQKYPAPTITEFSPSEGLPTTVVTIKGTEFGSERTERVGRVYFGGVEATEYVSWSDTEIQVRVPDGGVTGSITLWVWKNHTETTEQFTCVPGAEITGITPSPAFSGGTIEITGRNFQYFLDKGLTADDVVVEFAAENGIVEAIAKEFTSTTVVVDVPITAKGGTVTVRFGEFQTVAGPELPLIGDISIDLADYVETSGTITVEEGGIGSTKNEAYVIYKFTVPVTGLFDVYLMTGTSKDGSSLNVAIDTDLNTLKSGVLDESLTHEMKNTGSWDTTWKETWSAFDLEEGKTYYLKITFLQTGSTWVGNVGEIGLNLSTI